jgi:hypothetical protein
MECHSLGLTWKLRGSTTTGSKCPFEVEVSVSGRSPSNTMVYFCRDTLEANVTLSLWEMDHDSNGRCVRRQPSIIDELVFTFYSHLIRE